MPELHFTIELPDGARRQCYSPSTIVRNYFHAGDELSVSDFLARSQKAFQAASERVRTRYGFACSSAAAQLADIQQFTGPYPRDARVRLITI